MAILQYFIFCSLFISSYGIVEKTYNETEQIQALQQFLGIPLPTFKIPDLLNPDKSDESPSIRKRITQGKMINIGLPTLPNLLPTALPNIKLPTIKIPNLIPTALPTIKIPDIIPKTLPTIKIPQILPTALPTIKIPDIIPKTLPTLPPFEIPTIKLPTFPHILPTAFPTLFPKPTIPTQGITPNTPYTLPYPLPSDVVPIPFLNNKTNVESNIICEICENAVTVAKVRFSSFEKAVRSRLTDLLGKICDTLLKIPATAIMATPCNLFKANIIEKAFNKLDEFENKIQPKTFCKHVPFCN